MTNANLFKNTCDKKPATTGFDKRRLSELVQAAAGNRSISEYSKDSGLNRALIGNIINEKLDHPPAKSSLYKLANPITAKPQNNVDIQALLQASGYEYTNIPVSSNMGKGSLKIQDAIAASYTSSPTHSISIFLDMLINTNSLNSKRNVDIGMRGSWFWIKDIERNAKFTVIPAFCNHESGAEIIMIMLKATLLDTISTEESINELGERAVYILTDREDVYLSAKKLPRLASKSMAVLKTDENHKIFEKGVWISHNNVLKPWNPASPLTEDSSRQT